MTIKVNKTTATSFCGKTNPHGLHYKLCESAITRTHCIRDVGVLIDKIFIFYQLVDNVFSQTVRLLPLIQTVIFSSWSLHFSQTQLVICLC